MSQKTLIIGAIAAITLFAQCKKEDEYSMSTTDRDYMNKIAYANNSEVELGKFAANTATGETTRAFGDMMVNDHTTAEIDLQSVAEMKKQTLPTIPDSAHISAKQLLTTMVGTLRFDSAYLHMQVTDHENTISLLQTIITSAADNDLKNYANKYLPKVKMHKQKADSIINELGF